MTDSIIVTRHSALIEVLREDFGVEGKVLAQATVEEVAGKHVYGVLPMFLAAQCEKLTTVTLNTPPELRGVELSVDQVRQYMGPLVTYIVRIES